MQMLVNIDITVNSVKEAIFAGWYHSDVFDMF